MQNSSGGKDKLGNISKRGDSYLRSLFTTGALAVTRMASGHVNRTQRPTHGHTDQCCTREESPCQPGAVHPWEQSGRWSTGATPISIYEYTAWLGNRPFGAMALGF
jgi:hypothetical protein